VQNTTLTTGNYIVNNTISNNDYFITF
jgi:hypothetical protein